MVINIDFYFFAVVHRDLLGIKNGTISDSQLTASSEWNSIHGPDNARLDRPNCGGRTGAWSAKHNDTNQWIQIDFGEVAMVTGVKIQGRQDCDQWVTRFKVMYTSDDDWEFVKGPSKEHDMVRTMIKLCVLRGYCTPGPYF